MRSIAQPGPPAPERIQWVEARGRAFSFTLQAGLPLLEAARRGFAAEGFAGGVLNIRGGALGPFAYVMPALSKTGENAAFYSDTFRPAGVTRLKMGAMTLGVRDGAPFFHCHALWTRGRRPPRRRPYPARGDRRRRAVRGGRLRHRRRDLQRRSRTPRPISNCSGRCRARSRDAKTTSRAFALRLRPNQDFAGALEAFCRQRGISRARSHGGVGSTIGARFTDGRSVEPFATELAVRSGAIAPGADGTLEAELDVALVDYLGGLAEGRLVRGDNPVLMTMELVLEVLGEGTGA